MLVDPALEGRRVAQREAVEKTAAIQRERALVRRASQRILQLPHVARNQRGIEPQRLLAEDEITAFEVMPLEVQQLIQPLAGVLRVALRPQVGLDLVAVHPAIARHREQGEQGEPEPPCGSSGRRLSVNEQREAAHHRETQLVVNHTPPSPPTITKYASRSQSTIKSGKTWPLR